VVRFDPVPMPYALSASKGHDKAKTSSPVAPPYPPHFDNNARCEYQAEAPGHNIKSCLAFKYTYTSNALCFLNLEFNLFIFT
jgi:hypothetical protein